MRPGRAAAEAAGRALDKAARQVPRNAKNAWDRIINDAVNRTVAGELTIEQAMQQAMDDAARQGIGFYRDATGRKWGLDTYSEMAIRTGTNQALRDAHAAELLAQGIDLVIVSSHASPAPQCAPYEQKVLSLTGEHPNGRQTIDGQSVTVTASIAEAEANGLHHPNCRHTHTAYLPGITEPLPVADDPGHEGYKATQQQRYYEREIRRSQRMEAAATTPEARAKTAARRRAYEAKLAAHRKQWDLPRRRHREQFRGPSVPIAPQRAAVRGFGNPGSSAADTARRSARYVDGTIQYRPYPSLAETPRIFRPKATVEVRNVNPRLYVPRTGKVQGMRERPYLDNCVRAVVAMEMRNRGYDVKAGAGGYRTPRSRGDLTDAIDTSFLGGGDATDLVAASDAAQAVSNPGTQAMLATRDLPNGSRGIISATVKDPDSPLPYGHVWIWIKEDGEVKFLDPQRGLTDATSHFRKIEPGTLDMRRLDNLEITDDALFVVGGDEEVWL